MPRELPLVPSIPNYRVQTVLGETAYIFDVRWNGREECWYLDLRAADGTPIAVGRKIVIGFIGTRTHVPEGQPKNFGALLTVDLEGKNLDAGLDDLGTRVRVYWYSPDELRELFS